MNLFRISILLSLTFLVLAAESCTVKRDCRGRVKHKLSNGIWM